jgi:hypothetical protein
VVTKPKYVEELRKVSEDELSASQALNEVCFWSCFSEYLCVEPRIRLFSSPIRLTRDYLPTLN